jgi:hypothetical protein
MATTFKALVNDDVVNTRSLLHESVPITGSLVSGSYNNTNIKNYSHQYFQGVYDYNYSSASANHLFDITAGYSTSGYSSSLNIDNAKKTAIYTQMAQTLVGYDATGSILRFDEDGDIIAGGNKIDNAYFICLSRLLTKDEIKKGSVSLVLGLSGSWTTPHHGADSGSFTIADTGAATDYYVNSPAGEYGLLKKGTGIYGLVFYQAGVIVLNAETLYASSSGQGYISMSSGVTGVETVEWMFRSGSITGSADAFRRRLGNLSFQNTTELNSTIYFARAGSNEFNYSSNPTYLSGSKIRVKNVQSDSPTSYITGVGMYSSDGELLAVAKVSEPLRKSPDTELTLRVRIDF